MKTLKKLSSFLFVLFFLCLCFSDHACSQDTKERLGDKYLLELIKKAPAPEDLPNIPAAYLLMEEHDFVNPDGTATYEMHVIWKVLDLPAMASGEIAIPFDSSDSVLEVDIARTITPDGTIVNVDKDHIREVTPFSNFPMYSNVKIKQFSMPAMEIGSVIEYKVTLTVFKTEMEGLFWSYWSFPTGLPIRESIFEINLPSDMEGKYLSRNLNLAPEISTKDGRKIYKWVAKDIFIEGVYEPNLPPYDTVCPNITFATAKEWSDMAKWFYDISIPQTEPTQEIKTFVETVKKQERGNKEKIMEKLYSFVSQKIRYVAIPLKSSRYLPHKVGEIYTNKYGDCKDKSSLLISMYRLAGIEAHFALLKPRSVGPLVKDFPALDFTHCIVAIPEKDGTYTLLDTTMELNRFGYITTDMQDTDIFIVKKDGYEFLRLPFEKKNIGGSYVEMEMAIDENYDMEVTEKTTFSGDVEIGMRLNTKYSTRDAARAFFEQVVQSLYTKATLTSFDTANPEDLDDPFWINFKYTAEDHIKEAGKVLILDLPINTNRISQVISTEERVNPLWFPALDQNTSIINITIPANCKVNYMPPSIEKDTPFGYYRRTFSGDGKKIKIEYHLKTKMAEIPPSMYKDYKKFAEYIIKTSKESIILEKI